jgi:hypothetical protein
MGERGHTGMIVKRSRMAIRAAGSLFALLLLTSPAGAQAAGGKSIASAPVAAYGQQELGNTADDQFLKESCNFGSDAWRSYWSLNVLAGDLLKIDWQGMPGTELRLMPIGTTDFTLFQTEPAVSESLSSNNQSEAQYTAPQSGIMPLYFRVCDPDTPGPYSFVATDQHALATALVPMTYAYPNSVVDGSAHLADGSPAPDGLAFNLVAKWHLGDQLLRATSTATTAGGGLAFQLALPEETFGKVVRLAISRAADPSYQATRSTPVNVKIVGSPKPRRRHHRRHHHRRHHHRHHH